MKRLSKEEILNLKKRFENSEVNYPDVEHLYDLGLISKRSLGFITSSEDEAENAPLTPEEEEFLGYNFANNVD